MWILVRKRQKLIGQKQWDLTLGTDAPTHPSPAPSPVEDTKAATRYSELMHPSCDCTKQMTARQLN